MLWLLACAVRRSGNGVEVHFRVHVHLHRASARGLPAHTAPGRLVFPSFSPAFPCRPPGGSVIVLSIVSVTESSCPRSLGRQPGRPSMTDGDKHQLGLLLRRALAGDAGAWNDFFREIRGYLHAEVRKILGPGTQGALDHSSVVQSALRRVWERIGDQFPQGPGDAALRRFLAWVSTIARNRSWEELRRRRRERAEPAGSGLGGLADPRPQERALRRDRLAAEVAAALELLSEKERQVVELFWFERLSDAEIGERLGCSAGALRVLRFRALRKLRSPRLLDLLEESHDGRC